MVDDCGYVAAGPYVTMTRSRLLIIFVKRAREKVELSNFLVVGGVAVVGLVVMMVASAMRYTVR